MKQAIPLLKASIDDFKRNKIRTFLTSLGIMIGVFSVVILIGLGLGLKNYIQNQFESLGANLILILPGGGFTGEGGSGIGGAALVGGVSFDEKDVNSLKRISEIDFVVPVFMKGVTIEAPREEKFGYVMGINEDGFKLMNVKAQFGKLFDNSDVQASAKVGVMGNTIGRPIVPFSFPTKQRMEV